MISGNQKTLAFLLGFLLAFNLQADAAHFRQQQDKAQDPVGASEGKDDGDEGDDDSNAPTYTVKAPPKTPLGNAPNVAKDEEQEEQATEDVSKEKRPATKKEKMRLDLASNLREQADLKETVEHLSDESRSDSEIDTATSLVANETESVALGNTLGSMWKEMRMFEMPQYSEHVKSELDDLKHNQKALEAKLKEEGVKIESDKEEQDDGTGSEEEEETVRAAKQTEPVGEAGTSKVNFWHMDRQSQQQVFISSLVYLIGGLLFAFLFKQMRSKHFELEQRPDAHPNNRDFSFSVFGCLGDMKLCVLGFCCPCIAWANTLERRLQVPYWKAFLAFFGLMLLHAYTSFVSCLFVIGLGVFYRQKLRDHYGIENYETGNKVTVAVDLLLWGFCQPCAIIQEAREETCKRDKLGNP